MPDYSRLKNLPIVIPEMQGEPVAGLLTLWETHMSKGQQPKPTKEVDQACQQHVKNNISNWPQLIVQPQNNKDDSQHPSKNRKRPRESQCQKGLGVTKGATDKESAEPLRPR